jgi:glycosyltransferase involved in cell wall biosynthesis
MVRLVWASPLPPTRSGVSDYAVELLPEVARRARVRVVAPPDWRPGHDWPSALEVVPTDYRAEDDEIQVVHLGNNPYHGWVLPRLRAPNVVVVLHDVVLHHLLVERYLRDGGDTGQSTYRDALEMAHGAGGSALARARAAGVTGRRDPFLFPGRRFFLERAAGIVVHSAHARRRVAAELPEVPMAELKLPVADPGELDRGALRAELDLAPTDVVVMHLGFLTHDKGVHEVVTALGAAVAAGVPARLVLVGEGELLERLAHAVDSVGLQGRVATTGWVPAERFPGLPAAADLGVVLRTPSAGETSAAVLRFLACGTPVVVHGQAQFLEWPEPAAPRVTPGPGCGAELARWLVSAWQDGSAGSWSRRRVMARQTYEDGHRPPQVAEQMVRFLSRIQPEQ